VRLSKDWLPMLNLRKTAHDLQDANPEQ